MGMFHKMDDTLMDSIFQPLSEKIQKFIGYSCFDISRILIKFLFLTKLFLFKYMLLFELHFLAYFFVIIGAIGCFGKHFFVSETEKRCNNLGSENEANPLRIELAEERTKVILFYIFDLILSFFAFVFGFYGLALCLFLHYTSSFLFMFFVSCTPTPKGKCKAKAWLEGLIKKASSILSPSQEPIPAPTNRSITILGLVFD